MGLTTPPFFLNARRKAKTTWGVLDDSPVIVSWSGLDLSEQAEITLTLASMDNWIIFTRPLGPEKTNTPPILTGAQRILHTKGKASWERGWWRTGTDKLASYGLDTEVWISQDSTISNASILALEQLFQTKSEKDLPDMRSNGVETIYWAGAESGLMDTYNFPGVIYTTDVSKGSTGMGASTSTIPKTAGVAGWGEALEEARPAGPNLQQHAWPWRTPSPTIIQLRSLQTLKD